jgi:hypothetical protein
MFRCAKLFYCVRNDFFHHNHIHKQKIIALRDSGVSAEMVCFVGRSKFISNQSFYKSAKRYDVRVIVADDDQVEEVAYHFFVRQLLLFRRVVIHDHLSGINFAGIFKRSRFLSSKSSLITEFEGDIPSEFLYMESLAIHGEPSEVPSPALVVQYQQLLDNQRKQVEASNLVLVVTEEFQRLLSERYGHINSIVVPTMIEKSRRYFDADSRDLVRRQMFLDKKLVFLHLGGAVYPWHRFQETCAFIKSLQGFIPNLHFLGVVRSTDVNYAKECIASAGLSDAATVLTSPASEISKYLQASDCGLILRHNHTMTRVVDTSKLGEYLASGLPVVSTGAHAKTYIGKDTGAEINPLFIVPVTLKVTRQLISDLESHLRTFGGIEARLALAKTTVSYLSRQDAALRQYVLAVQGLL